MSTAIRPADVSRYLGRNSRFTGVERSVVKPKSYSAGYEVRGWTDGHVSVRYTGGSHQGGSPAYRAKVAKDALGSMMTALKWGYTVGDMGSYIKVTGRKEQYKPELRSQTVSAYLGKKVAETGIKRSEYSTTRIRGWGRWTEGYEVKQTWLGITVEFTWSSIHYHEDRDAARRAEKLEALKSALEEKYTVEYAERGPGNKVLVVKAK